MKIPAPVCRVLVLIRPKADLRKSHPGLPGPAGKQCAGNYSKKICPSASRSEELAEDLLFVLCKEAADRAGHHRQPRKDLLGRNAGCSAVLGKVHLA